MTGSLDVSAFVDQTRPGGTDVAGPVIGRGVPEDVVDALRGVVGVRSVVVGGQGLGADDRFGAGLDDTEPAAHVADHGVRGPTFGDALGDDFGGSGGEGLTVGAEVALGTGSCGDDGIEGDGDVEARSVRGHLAGQLVGDGNAVLGGGGQEATEQAVVGVDSVGPVGGDEFSELLKQGEVALRWIGGAGLDVVTGAADEAVEGPIEDAVQEDEGVVLGGAEDGVVVLNGVHWCL